MIINDENFDDIISSHKIILVDFWADWCRPCKMFSPILDEIEKETGIWVGKIDADANTKKVLQYEINSLPTTIIFKDGKEVKKIIGAKPKHQMIKELQEWL